MNPIYAKTAEILLDLVDMTWESQEAMDAAWANSPLGTATSLDRTKHADYLIRHLFNTAWKQAFITLNPGVTPQQAIRPLNADILHVCVELITLSSDYNLLSQILPNLVPHAVILDRIGCAKDLVGAMGALPPAVQALVSKGAKAKDLATLEASVQEKAHKAQSLNKTASTFEKFTPPSWRITPHGKTAALTDSAGVSNLPAIADPYVSLYPMAHPEPFKTAYITWDSGAPSAHVRPVPETPGAFTVVDMPNGRDNFVSESGGTMLGQVMLARGLTFDAYDFWANWCKTKSYVPFYALTKLSSIRLVGPEALLKAMEDDFMGSAVPSSIPGFAWSWDQRAPLQGVGAPEPVAE